MFRNRQSQKPSDDLYKHFKANFASLNGVQHPSSVSIAAAAQGAASLNDGQNGQSDSRPHDQIPRDAKDAEPTPKASNQAWNFGTSGLTPSVMDPNSDSFNLFANQMPGYYTPTPGGTNTYYHSQAGDLHTPGFMMGGLGTPLSLPMSEGALNAGHQVAAFEHFHGQQMHQMQSHHFQNVNPFQMHHPQGFPPHQFSNHPSFDFNEKIEDSPMDGMSLEHEMPQQQHHSPEMVFQQQSMQGAVQAPLAPHQAADQFRFHCTLNAPTAMTKHVDEIPITYLNKGQAYTLNVFDTTAARQPHNGSVRYRTFVRVSFEDEQQRQRPAGCWQLWKEGRGTNEAHQRGGRLQAVEFVECSQISSGDNPNKPHVELESASYDGFCVNWRPSPAAPECPISVRFNFLSTDFSHSKGVKGIPVRLCAKTEAIEDSPALSKSDPEVCYCKVKLFRDHGAERKLSNDVAHVKKNIDKLNQQIAQIESGMRDLGKRKRSGSVSKGNGDQRPGKIAKHRRTWSMASQGSTSGRPSAEEDLHTKLLTLQDMFSSTRPASVLYLRGSEEDDPDLHPVSLPGEDEPLQRTTSIDATSWERQSVTGTTSSLVSPSPSHNSLVGSRRDSNMQQPTPFGGPSRVNSTDWRSNTQTATMDIQQPAQPTANLQGRPSSPEHQAVKVQTRSPVDGSSSGWIEAVGVDQSYQPPPERAVKPVACFFVQSRIAGRHSNDHYHRAVYLMQRTLKDFVTTLAMKCNIEPTQVVRTVHISRQGLHVLFDDDCIKELPEGQDMTAEFNEIHPDSPSKLKREWDACATDVQCDGDLMTTQNTSSSSYELKLLY